MRFTFETGLRELLIDDGRVAGVLARRAGEDVTIRARHGVLLSAGGFARNQALRETFGPQPASTEWTHMIEEDTGDAFEAAVELGAATAGLDNAYWLPSLVGFDGQPLPMVLKRGAAAG